MSIISGSAPIVYALIVPAAATLSPRKSLEVSTPVISNGYASIVLPFLVRFPVLLATIYLEVRIPCPVVPPMLTLGSTNKS